jgi:hypothetical protein
MEKKTAGLLGAVAGLAAMGTAQAAIHPASMPSEVLQASSYADLLAPIPNALALLRADDEARAQEPLADDLNGVQLVQGYYYNQPPPPQYYGNPYPYNRPDYHSPYYRRHHHHHHHHHHHNHHHSAFIGLPGLGGLVIGAR